MSKEIIVSGYCRNADMSRVLVCDPEKNDAGEWDIDLNCDYPGCIFAGECRLIARVLEEVGLEG